MEDYGHMKNVIGHTPPTFVTNMAERTIWYEYFDIKDLPVGEVPYQAIHIALKDEKYMRRFTPTHYRENLMQGHLAAIMYWYPYYVDYLYEIAIDGRDFREFYIRFPREICLGFETLFPDMVKKLDKLSKKTMKLNSLGEFEG